MLESLLTRASKKQKTTNFTHIDAGIYRNTVSNLPNECNRGCYSLKNLLSMDGPLELIYQLNFLLNYDWFVEQITSHSKSAKIFLVVGNRESNFINTESTRFIIPHVEMYGTHHSKMMVLFTKTNRCRIVIHTSNLRESDWGKTQLMWISPLLSRKGETSPSACQFEADLINYFKAYKLAEMDDLCERLRSFDFTVCRAVLVASVPGYHKGDQMHKWGHMKVRKELTKVELADSTAKDQIIMQFSSVGSLGKTEDSYTTSELLRSFSTTCSSRPKIPDVKLVYPSVQDVARNLDGWLGGASLPFKSATFAKQKWMLKYLCKWNSIKAQRHDAVPHLKTYTRIDPETGLVTYLLLTSSNLSKAAHGVLQKGGTQLHIRSYEIGVLIYPALFKASASTGKIQMVNRPPGIIDQLNLKRGMFEEGVVVMSLPYDIPLVPYSGSDKPFLVDGYYGELKDRKGMTKAECGM